MELTDEIKAGIDARSAEQLFFRWRNAPVGDPMFQGASGEYWAKRMAELMSQPGGDVRHTAASKAIGWGESSK